MDRREFMRTVAGTVAVSVPAARIEAFGAANQSPQLSGSETRGGDSLHSTVPSGPPQKIAMLAYPQFAALDLMGPHTFLSGLMNVDVQLVWKNTNPVVTVENLTVVPNATLKDCPKTSTSSWYLEVSRARWPSCRMTKFYHSSPIAAVVHDTSPAFAPGLWYWVALDC
jgi:hypothetical protein